jgi:hypothetical protein
MKASATLLQRIVWMACAALPLLAQAEDEPAPRLALSVTQELQASDDRERTTHSMLWARAQAVSFGVGVEQRSRRVGELPVVGNQSAPMVQAQTLMLGVSIAATERTSIALQAPVWRDARERDAGGESPRMALRSRDTLGELRAGLQMKMQMGSQTSVALRPRKGGFGVTLRSHW